MSHKWHIVHIIVLFLCIFQGCFHDVTTVKQPPTISTFAASPDQIEKGDVTIIAWEVVNASRTSIEPMFGDVQTKGIIEFYPVSSCSLTIFAENEWGVSEKTVNIIVSTQTTVAADKQLLKPPVIHCFTAKPDKVWAGTPVTLIWEISDATSLFINWNENTSELKPSNTGSKVFNPVIPTWYNLVAANVNGSSSAMVKVDIINYIPDEDSHRERSGG